MAINEGDIKSHCVKLIISLLHGQMIDIFGKLIRVEKGIMQGSPLSPKLFNFLVDCVLKQSSLLNHMCVQNLIGMYADDMAIELDSATTVFKVITELENLARDNLSLNKKKTKAIASTE